MKLGAIQPGYLPWLGHYEQIAYCDIFLILQDLEFSTSSWVNRNRILNNGIPQWLTIPLISGSHTAINKKKINNSSRWRNYHIKSIQNSYPFGEIGDSLLSIIQDDESEYLLDYLRKINDHLYSYLALNKKIHYVNAFDIHQEKNMRLIELCKSYGCNEYISGQLAQQYIDLDLFKKNNISVIFQKFTPMTYPQKSSSFVSHLSIIDALLNQITPEEILKNNFFNSTPLNKINEQ